MNHRDTEGAERIMENNGASLTSIVLYAHDLEQLRVELTTLGIVFERHERDGELLAYISKRNNLYLELCPTSESNPPTYNKICLAVDNIDAAIEAARSIHAKLTSGPDRNPWADSAQFNLPSGVKVTLLEAH